MFDFTGLSRAVACTLLVYVAAWPVGAVVLAVTASVFHIQGVAHGMRWLSWPAPLVFPLAALVLVVDYVRRLAAGHMTVTQVTGHRAAAVMMIGGSAFALGSGHWQPLAGCGTIFLLLLLPQRGKALPSTWTPN